MYPFFQSLSPLFWFSLPLLDQTSKSSIFGSIYSLQESPSVFNLYSDLSPLKFVKAPHSQGPPLASFSSPLSVFISPRGQICPKSMEMDAADLKWICG